VAVSNRVKSSFRAGYYHLLAMIYRLKRKQMELGSGKWGKQLRAV